MIPYHMEAHYQVQKIIAHYRRCHFLFFWSKINTTGQVCKKSVAFFCEMTTPDDLIRKIAYKAPNHTHNQYLINTYFINIMGTVCGRSSETFYVVTYYI